MNGRKSRRVDVETSAWRSLLFLRELYPCCTCSPVFKMSNGVLRETSCIDYISSSSTWMASGFADSSPFPVPFQASASSLPLALIVLWVEATNMGAPAGLEPLPLVAAISRSIAAIGSAASFAAWLAVSVGFSVPFAAAAA